jgi:hypothetical protein
MADESATRARYRARRARFAGARSTNRHLLVTARSTDPLDRSSEAGWSSGAGFVVRDSKPTLRRSRSPRMRSAAARPPAAVLALLLAVAAQPLLAAGAISHWAFDETSGTTAEDDLIGANDGTLVGGAVFAPGEGIHGGAVRLGSGASVTMGDVLGSEAFPSGNFSISVWFRAALPAPTEQWIVSKHQAGNLNGYALAIGSNGGTGGTSHHAWLYVSSLPGALPISTTAVDDGYWHHLVGVYDSLGGSVEIYVDGNLEDTAEDSAHVDNAASFSIGGIGLVDEASFFAYALSPGEVEALFDEFWVFHDHFESGGFCEWSTATPPCG